jgi:AcrR family transcriptional regulator
MPQVRKESVRQRILRSADRLFETRSYVDTTLAAIARDARTSVGNTYVYFRSKVEIFFTLYTPWFREQIERIEQAAARIDDPDERLVYILEAYWCEIPNSRLGFSNNLIQAISAAGPGERTFELFWWSSQRLVGMLRDCLPPARHGVLDGYIVTDILVMAYGGYSINYKFGFPTTRVKLAARLMADLLRGNPVPRHYLDSVQDLALPGALPALQSEPVAAPARAVRAPARRPVAQRGQRRARTRRS